MIKTIKDAEQEGVLENCIYNADCLDLMPHIKSKSIDIIITSPPYNLGNTHHTGDKKHKAYEDNLPEKEYQQWQVEVLGECFRVLKDDGSIFYNHKNRIRQGVQISPYEWLFKTDFIIKQEIVWFNGSQNFDKIRFYPMTERIYWMSKSPKTKLFNAINHHDVFGRDEWKPVGTKKEHTRAYPEKMVEDILMCFENAQIVLDPFAGSFTTAIASENLKRNWICIEKEAKYCEIGKKRIKKL